MSQVTHIWIGHVAHMKEPSHTLGSSRKLHLIVKNPFQFKKVWRSHVKHMNQSCRTHLNESCHPHVNRTRHTYEGVFTHMWISHVIPSSPAGKFILTSCPPLQFKQCMQKSRHSYECVISHTCKWVMSHVWMSHATHVSAISPLCLQQGPAF